LAIGGAAALSQVAEAGAFAGMTVIAARIGEDSVAAYQVLLNMLAVVFMIAMGFAAAASVVTAEALSAGNPNKARQAGWLALGLNTLGMLACGVVLWIFGMDAARLYTSDSAIALVIAGAMGLLVLVLVFDGAQVVLAQTLRARQDNVFPTASHVLAYVIVMPPLAFLLAERLGRGVAGLMEAILIASVLSAFVLMARLVALTRPKSNPLPRSQPQ
jgi:MATE family multidrug resistance protein